MGTTRMALGASESHPELFDALAQVIALLHGWVHEGDVPAHETALDVVQMAFIIRGFNQFRGLVQLLRTNHWEDALILTRSMYELLLNCEELHRQSDREHASRVFAHFQQLQTFLSKMDRHGYHLATGRLSPEAKGEIDRMEREGRKVFKRFVYKNRKGKICWWKSWHSKQHSVRELAERSENALRSHQYTLLYGRGSDFVHASPIAVFASTLIDEPSMSWEQFEERSFGIEDQELIFVASMALTLFIELMLHVGSRLPKYEDTALLDTSERFMKAAFGLDFADLREQARDVGDDS